MKFPKKSLGQNFLIDFNIIRKIVNTVKIKNKNIIEIGPGEGALTDELLKREPKTLVLIEKDNELSKKLKIKYYFKKNIKILNKDILNFKLEQNLLKDTIIFGNLPYNISSQILVQTLKFNKWPPSYSDIIFMFQKELGEKILGKFGSSEYGRLSILTNYRFLSKKKFIVSPNSFFPRPKVNSMVIHFKPKENNQYKIKKIQNLELITRILFSNKRKMINKNIQKILDKDKLNKLDINLQLRPSELRPEVYYKIAKLIEKD